MTNPALVAIEEVYEMALNPTQSYFAQLEPLAASGELANRISTNKVLFRLAELVDNQAKEIKALKDDRQAIAAKMVELESKLQFTKDGDLKIDAPTPDPTQPIGDTTV